MNTLSRIITGTVITLFGVSIFFASLSSLKEGGVWGIIWALLFIALGLYIFFNKKEDDIEQIKK